MTEPLKDPLGVQPAPVTGDPFPDRADRARAERATAAARAMKGVWIESSGPAAVIEEIVGYVETYKDQRGTPIEGRRLSEDSNAGKSRTMERLIEVMAERRREAGLPDNPNQVVYVELDESISVRSFYRQILLKLNDDHWNDKHAATDELEERIDKFVGDLGVELLIGDEIQHLDRVSDEAGRVTNRLKTFCNRGIVPVVLVGDETSVALFDKNPKFASRFGDPLKLAPLDFVGSGADRQALLAFCGSLDATLVDRGAMSRPSGLAGAGIRTPLARASGGHLGRVVRIVQHAMRHAIQRGADRIEQHDLSYAVRRFAMPLKWVAYDPFSKRLI